MIYSIDCKKYIEYRDYYECKIFVSTKEEQKNDFRHLEERDELLEEYTNIF